MKLTNAGGAVTKSYDYDAETGTYYLRARYYAPALGRFTQQDTHWNTANMIYGDDPQKINEREDALGLKHYSYVPQITAVMQSGNLYVYGVNDPLLYKDPSGKALINVVFGAIGAIAGWGFGDYVATNLKLSGWKYWTVRGAVTIGGAAIGWFAGSTIAHFAASYLRTNPKVAFKLANTMGATSFAAAMKFLGINPFSLVTKRNFAGFLEAAFNTPEVQIGLDWACSLIEKAQQWGYSI